MQCTLKRLLWYPSPGSESEDEDHWPAHAKYYNPVTGQVNEKFSVMCETFLENVNGT
jgi:hypothetical protein